ncbi:MAG: glycosyltransferase [Thermoleophilia bacterium]|nr:glycosyltransferase [Thermoleophilia bacterium]
MTRLVVVTQRVDPGDPVLGATVAKLRALAERVDELVVLADGAVAGVLPGNCRVRLFGARRRSGRGLRFALALADELRRSPRPVGVLAHMCPIYAVLAAPLARPLRVPVLLWFTHWRASGLLRLAERVSSTVLSVDERTFPLPSRKLRAIGHGIDVGGLACVERPADGPLRLLALGRTSPAKGLETAIRAVVLVADATLEIRGPSLTAEERSHRVALEQLAADLGVANRVRIEPPVPRDEVPAVLARHDALVNDMRAGATDKVVFEAAASCLPVFASNPAFDRLLPDGLRFPAGDADALARRLRALAHADRAALGRALRDRVLREHAVDGWAGRVLEAAGRARDGV